MAGGPLQSLVLRPASLGSKAQVTAPFGLRVQGLRPWKRHALGFTGDPGAPPGPPETCQETAEGGAGTWGKRSRPLGHLPGSPALGLCHVPRLQAARPGPGTAPKGVSTALTSVTGG